MKKTISVYIIFGFLLTSFTGCGKLKSSPAFGLNQSETSTPSEVVNQPEPSISSETVSQPDTSASSEVNSQSEKVEPALVAQETKPVQTFEPLSTSNKDLTEEKILERSEREKIEILERELKLFDPKDSYDVETLQAIIDQRNSLIGKLIDVKGDYYNRLLKVRSNEEIFELAEREIKEILERELELFNPKDIRGYGTHQIVIDHRNSLVAQLMNVRKDYYDYLLKGKNNSKQ